jgi:signal transduction histidine kinase
MGQVALILQNAQLFTEVHAGRERLQTLSRQLVALQEAERAHLARELHDEIGQMLTGLNVQLEVGTRIPPSMLAERMALAQGLVRDLTRQVRELSLSLRPAMLDDLGLLVTLEWFVQRYTAQTRIAVQFTHHGLGQRFAPAVEITTYRIVQEALTNAARHACVQTVSVSVSADSSRLSLMIEDQGRGFDREQIRRSPTSHGLIGLRERALLLGGFVMIASSPGLGTRLSAELPLSQPHEQGGPWR